MIQQQAHIDQDFSNNKYSGHCLQIFGIHSKSNICPVSYSHGQECDLSRPKGRQGIQPCLTAEHRQIHADIEAGGCLVQQSIHSEQLMIEGGHDWQIAMGKCYSKWVKNHKTDMAQVTGLTRVWPTRTNWRLILTVDITRKAFVLLFLKYQLVHLVWLVHRLRGELRLLWQWWETEASVITVFESEGDRQRGRDR